MRAIEFSTFYAALSVPQTHSVSLLWDITIHHFLTNEDGISPMHHRALYVQLLSACICACVLKENKQQQNGNPGNGLFMYLYCKVRGTYRLRASLKQLFKNKFGMFK